jgi:Coenzyme PQQ synthesis protein D (PqqD)
MGERLRLREDAVDWRLVQGEVIALDRARSEYLAVNATGTVLWEALSGGATAEELSERLVAAHGLERDVAERDVAAFLDDLRGRGLLDP